MTDKKDDIKLPSIDRRALFAGAAGLAAVALTSQEAKAGAHVTAKVDLKEEDYIGKRVENGAQVLVTGANRGLGLEFTRMYAERGCKVIATARNPKKADALNELAANNPDIVVEKLDVTDHKRIEKLAEVYKDTPIDLLLNNAGIGGGIENQFFGKMNYDVFSQVMDVNVAGPMKMSEAFYKNVEASELKKIVSVSSSQGSITQVKSALLYFYRGSKAALNMQMVNLAFQLQRKRIIVGLVTPGATATDFIPEKFQKAIKGIQTPEEATRDMIRNIDRFCLANTGTFFDYTGKVVPW